MTKTVKTQSIPGENKKRLQEIAEVRFGTLSDDDILRILSERKRLSELEREYERVQKEEEIRLEQEQREAALKAQEKKKNLILKKIEELNKSISPDKQDDALLALVAQRQELEKELEGINDGTQVQSESVVSESVPAAVVAKKDSPEEETPEPVKETGDEVLPQEQVLKSEQEATAGEIPIQDPRLHVEEEYGKEKIQNAGMETTSEFDRYLNQLKNNVGSLGELLQNMSQNAKKNKAFMLKVAEIDPAYAMHFADKETLKRDEDFNLRIASLRNLRNSGNALAEMLPEARTSKVLLAAVKQDYRNIRFIQPNMADYDEMIGIAKKNALEKVKDLKEAADATLLIPKVLQQDKQFMSQVKEIVESKKST